MSKQNNSELNKIHNGDCFDVMRSLILKGVQVDMVFADLPYGVTGYNWDKPLDLQMFWSLVDQLLAPNGVVVMTATPPFSAKLMLSNEAMFRYQWIWEKPNGSGHLNAKRRPLACHEEALIFSALSHEQILVFHERGVGSKYNPQKTHGHERKTANRKPKDDSGFYNADSKASSYDSTSRYPRDVLKFPHDKPQVHPTQKPVDLCAYMIKTYTDKGAVVYDPTAGAGSTGVACLKTGRHYIMSEIREEFCLEARDRVKNVQQELFAM